jgi:hypothetical protein
LPWIKIKHQIWAIAQADRIGIQPQERNKTWGKGIVFRKLQTRSYDIRKEDGTVIKIDVSFAKLTNTTMRRKGKKLSI